MRSGKTKAMLQKIEPIKYSNHKYRLIRPDVDDRKDRLYTNEYIYIRGYRPQEILDISQNIDIIGIDELQFFDKSIVDVILDLQKENKYIIGAGLDLNHKGKLFNGMGELMGIANIVHKLTAICEKEGCNNIATRTQRLDANQKPITGNAPEIEVGDGQYRVYCLEHFIK